MLEVTHKQIGQLYREWHAIVDVIDVRSSAGLREHEEEVWAPHPPASVAEQSARAALRLRFLGSGLTGVSSMNAPWVSVMRLGNLQLECASGIISESGFPFFLSQRQGCHAEQREGPWFVLALSLRRRCCHCGQTPRSLAVLGITSGWLGMTIHLFGITLHRDNNSCCNLFPWILSIAAAGLLTGATGLRRAPCSKRLDSPTPICASR